MPGPSWWSMAEGRWHRTGALAVAAAVALCCVLTLGVPQAQTHSRHEGSVELYRGVSGPYDVLVEAVPRVGFLEVTVVFAPDAPDVSLPYIPRVVVQAERKGERVGPATATRPLGLRANEYTAVLEPSEVGEWTITVSIDGEPGSATLTFRVEIVGGRGFPWPALLAGLGVVLPILWLVLAPRRKRSRT